jgi:hypothetical protein
MKLKVLAVSLAALVALLVAAPGALAWQYHLPFYKAQNSANRFTKELCAEDAECIYWTTKCLRVNDQRVTCAEGTWDEGTEEGETLRCIGIEKFGIAPGGYIKETFGKPHCGYVYGT